MIRAGRPGRNEPAACRVHASVVVIDFETTGLSPRQGARAIEVAAVRLEEGCIVDRFQHLMNPGVRIPPFIQGLTGISNAMVRSAPHPGDVMAGLAEFIGDAPLIAHNAGFDCQFLDAELARIDRTRRQEFLCSLLVSRRIYPEAPSHKLGVLAEFIGLHFSGRAHRALADAEITALLWVEMVERLQRQYALDEVPLSLLKEIQGIPKGALPRFMGKWRLRQG
jgi:DNA polymerase III subunit epsilon